MVSAVTPEFDLNTAVKKGNELKAQGNTLYKAKKFEEALALYDEAIAAHPYELIYYSNKAAVFIEMGKFEEVVKCCEEALAKRYEVTSVYKDGASFETCAKLFNRIAVAAMKMKSFDLAIENYRKALTEDNNRHTRAALKEAERAKEAHEREAYIDPAKAEEHRVKGNDFFKANKYADAKLEYDEAIRRNPSDAKLYSNRAAALTKLIAYPDALRDLETCLKIDPSFVKAYSRKGTVHVLMKDYSKALEAYNMGLEVDPSNQECQQGKRNVMMTINQSSASSEADPEQIRHAMADPEVQQILKDPNLQMLIQRMSTDPKAAQEAFKDPDVRKKLEKLMAAGILKVQ